MGPRYPAGPRPGVRMPQMGNDFNGVSLTISLQYIRYCNILKKKKIEHECPIINIICNNFIFILATWTTNDAK